MLNLVEKYSAEAPMAAEDGVVAIEYVVLAVAVIGVVGAIALVLSNATDGLAKRLTDAL